MSYDAPGFSGHGHGLQFDNVTAQYRNDDAFGQYVHNPVGIYEGSFSNGHDVFQEHQVTPNHALVSDVNANQTFSVGSSVSGHRVPLSASLSNSFPLGVMQHGMHMSGVVGGGFNLNSFSPQGPFDQSTHPPTNPYLAFGTPASGFPTSPFSFQGFPLSTMTPTNRYISNAQYQERQLPLEALEYPTHVVHQPMNMGPEASINWEQFEALLPMLAQNAPKLSNSDFPYELVAVIGPEPSAHGTSISNAPEVNAQPSSAAAPAPAPSKAKRKAKEPQKPRSSTSAAATGRKRYKACAPASQVPCPMCDLKFQCKKNRDRHLNSVHGVSIYYCPGAHVHHDKKYRKCKGGYAREDSLVRHLKYAHDKDTDHPCVVEAMRLGWDPYELSSVQKLRGVQPAA